MKKFKSFIFALFLVFPLSLLAEFPEKPIKIVVYTAPGGLIDVTARKAAQIIQENFADQAVIVENKKGAGGLVALSHVLRQPADGYTVFGLTSSVISKVTQAKADKKLSDLHYLVRMIDDYECLITNKKDNLNTLDQLKADALEKKGKQIWVGPASFGTDHLFAQRVWDELGIRAKWVPFKNGPQAVVSLMGSHGDVYVGSPQDTLGRKGLNIVAVASPERLEGFPNTPTFKELGYNNLVDESLWRGFAIKKGTSQSVSSKLENLFKKVNEHPDWIKFLKQGSVVARFDTNEEFTKLVQSQIERDSKFFRG